MSQLGRPRALDDVKRREVCALISAGCGIPDAARYVGCSVSTIRRETLRSPEFKNELRGAEIHSQLQSLQAMRKAADSHWQAAAWMLERTNPRRFARPSLKTYRAEEVRDAIDQIIETAVEEIQDPETQDRVCRRLLVAAHQASRALDDAERRRRDPSAANSRRRSSADRWVDDLLAGIDQQQEEAYRNLFGKGQNPNHFA